MLILTIGCSKEGFNLLMITMKYLIEAKLHIKVSIKDVNFEKIIKLK